MYDDEVTIWAPLRAIGETMHRRICPLYTFAGRDRIHIAGSAVPFRAGGFRFLLTAKHVCFDSSNTPIPLFTMGSEHARPLCGRKGAWEYLPGKTPEIDLAVIALDDDLADDLEGVYQFATPGDISKTTTKTPGIHYLIAGYPAERNPVSIKDSTVWIGALATHLITGDIRETAEALPNKSDDFHFVLGHPGKVIPTYGGARFRTPKVQGMSGGGVWRVEIDIPRRLSTSPSLVGIGIEYHKAKQVFVATRVQAAIPLVDDLFRLERGLPADSQDPPSISPDPSSS
ncbi:MAG TPA: hypothetical protein VIJ01_06910 [Candidatus Angelobacter sp.]